VRASRDFDGVNGQEQFLAQFPSTLPKNEIIATNNVTGDVHTHRRYEWEAWSFDVPPGVFMPGPTSRLIHERLRSGEIDVRARRFVSVGVGLGIETLVAGLAGANEVVGIDIHEPSVRAARSVYLTYGPSCGAPFTGYVSDLFENVDPALHADVMVFNPPFIDVPISSDPAIRRTIASGLPLARRFFAELTSGAHLDQVGRLYMLLSNTAPLREILRLALAANLAIDPVHTQIWSAESTRTYLFEMRWAGPSA